MTEHGKGNQSESARGLSDVFIIAMIVTVTLFVFSEVRTFDLLSYDDTIDISDNPHVNGGLTVANVRWVFTHQHAANWFPLTLISYMLTIQLFGASPAAHHIVGLMIHVINSVLLFIIVSRLFPRITAARWRGAFVAMLFAVHPMHVESVAWVAERKDVLSVFFGFLAIMLYMHYAQRPSVMKYLGALLCFIFSLMSKAMLVTLPFLLLLLDFWPLGRFNTGIKRLLVEKIPFIVFSAAVSIITILSQKAYGTVASLEEVPLNIRLVNIPVSYVKYILKMFYPNKQAFLYLLKDDIPLWHTGAAVVVLLMICVFAVVMARRLPYILTGWFWYVGTLVPVIGFVQVGLQAMADRYTYIPYVGLFIIAAMAVPDSTFRTPRGKTIVSVAAAVLIILCAAKAKAQVNYWRTSVTLYHHAIEVDENNYIAYYNLGTTYISQGRVNEAVTAFKKAILIRPTYSSPYTNLGMALLFQLQRPEEAIGYFYKAIELNPLSSNAYNGVGASLAILKRPGEAIAYFEKALELDPNFEQARSNLARARREAGL
ncbi:tetratricopeptide repeat protein [Candidatus Magnetominusculus xianensis]|uniref:Tetratricopeptide TPR_2 repeat protein n=1 Tax=Candidatus Magnetominusculus xianensis TaxID=1748249 RepID=A0ABR5SC35_9BACT|nr:tetratricopeptide repeat protein [Candidatus Magnetominusculus xianensis]KWT78994.1 tetratricopeptide TPR_2 repeat protein [Candidatus Magnetominusculus xianensis]MBF0404999.1 tetratricopeptide repeat protein [Nitrospirota bacterium]